MGSAPDNPKSESDALAIYHLSAKPISRASGRSATAAAAYRAGIAIRDARTGVIYDYTRKAGVLYAELILPIDGIADRADFWNRIEAHHKRRDAVLAREIEISLPREITSEQREKLAISFARELAHRYGVAVDVALHAPRVITDRDLERNPQQYWQIDTATGKRHNGNWHAHLMLSACYVLSDGSLGKKAVELDPIHCQRRQVENMVERERIRWAELANASLHRDGFEVQVDHRSHADRNIAAIPTQHLGPQSQGIERRTKRKSSIRMDQGEDVLTRLAHAKVIGELERQEHVISKTILDLSGDLAAALRVRDLRKHAESLHSKLTKRQSEISTPGTAYLEEQEGEDGEEDIDRPGQ
jgi:ATP-dependent exoDNAse (exonuclease V) alpha subunit